MEQEIKTVQNVANIIIDFFVNYSFQVVGAILVLIAGFMVARFTAAFFLRFFERKNVDVTLARFIASTVKVLIVVFAVIIALGKFGITIAPFIAALAAMAFGASFAIQGPVSNYGAGLVIVLTRPFVVGDTVTVAGVSGVVEEVKLGATRLTDEDGVQITVPNKHVVGEILHNSAEWRIAESVVGISYGSDPERGIEIIKETLAGFGELSEEHGPQVGIQDFGDSSINIGYRYWLPSRRYFEILYRVNLAVYRALQAAGMEIPFPQRDVRIVSDSAQKSPVPAT